MALGHTHGKKLGNRVTMAIGATHLSRVIFVIESNITLFVLDDHRVGLVRLKGHDRKGSEKNHSYDKRK